LRLIVDSHLHIYPCYDLRAAIDTLRLNLSKLDRKAICIGILTEATGYNYYEKIKKNPQESFNPDVEISTLKNAILIREPGYPDLYLFPGRQIITNEKIEILCLMVDLNIENGLPAREVIDKIRLENGVPVLSWAPGKWFFKRGKIVRKLIDSGKSGSLLLGDTSLRPACWPKSTLMRRAGRKGIAVVCGSDPLPFGGEEQVMGRYGTFIDCEFDVNDPIDSLRNYLLQPGSGTAPAGKRGGLFFTLSRLFKHAQSKKK